MKINEGENKLEPWDLGQLWKPRLEYALIAFTKRKFTWTLARAGCAWPGS